MQYNIIEMHRPDRVAVRHIFGGWCRGVEAHPRPYLPVRVEAVAERFRIPSGTPYKRAQELSPLLARAHDRATLERAVFLATVYTHRALTYYATWRWDGRRYFCPARIRPVVEDIAVRLVADYCGADVLVRDAPSALTELTTRLAQVNWERSPEALAAVRRARAAAFAAEEREMRATGQWGVALLQCKQRAAAMVAAVPGDGLPSLPPDFHDRVAETIAKEAMQAEVDYVDRLAEDPQKLWAMVEGGGLEKTTDASDDDAPLRLLTPAVQALAKAAGVI